MSILREIERHLDRLEPQDDRTLVVLRVREAARGKLPDVDERIEVAAR
jgi:hypothetical protein